MIFEINTIDKNANCKATRLTSEMLGACGFRLLLS